MNDFDRALADFNRAIKLEPNNAVVYLNRCVVYQRSKDADGALADYNRAIELEPKQAFAYGNLAFVYMSKGSTIAPSPSTPTLSNSIRVLPRRITAARSSTTRRVADRRPC